jgi:hypothetical protein
VNGYVEENILWTFIANDLLAFARMKGLRELVMLLNPCMVLHECEEHSGSRQRTFMSRSSTSVAVNIKWICQR